MHSLIILILFLFLTYVCMSVSWDESSNKTMSTNAELKIGYN